MKKLVFTVSVFMLGTTLFAQPYNYELEPYIGMNFTDSSSALDDSAVLGLKLNNYLDQNYGVQLGFERVLEADSKYSSYGGSGINRYFVNGLYRQRLENGLLPYFFGGFGYEDIDKSCPCDCSQWFLDAGAGLKYQLNENLNLLTEAKVLRKFKNSNIDFVGSLGLGYMFNMGANPAFLQQEVQIPVVEIEPEPKPQVIVREVPVVMEKAPVVEKSTVSDCPQAQIDPAKDSCNGPYYIQVGARIKCLPSDRVKDKKLFNKIKRLGYNYIIYDTSYGGKDIAKVLVGPYRCLSDAKKHICKIRRNINSQAFIYRKR